MKIDNTIYLYVDINVGDEYCRGNNGRINSDVEVVYKVGSGDGISVNKVVKCVKGGVSVGVGVSVGWVVNSGVGSGIYIDNGIKFEIDDGYDLGCSDGSFYGFNYVKRLGSLLDDSLEKCVNLLCLSNIGWDVNAGVRRSVGRSIGWWSRSDVDSGFSSEDEEEAGLELGDEVGSRDDSSVDKL